MQRRLAILLAAMPVVASCAASPSPSAVAPPPTAFPSSLRAPASPVATASAGPAGHWEPAGELVIGRGDTHAVPLGDGSVLIVGSDQPACMRDDSVVTEAWQADGGAYEIGALPRPRADFAAVPLGGDGVLVVGGVDPGSNPEGWWSTTPELGRDTTADDPIGIVGDHRSDASAWAWSRGGWKQVASLGTPRTEPAAAVLGDGRVLVAGGYYLRPTTDGSQAGSTALLAAFGGGVILANDGPSPSDVPALATAEIYDPASNSWSKTGNLRYARVGAQAVTLADGRVLVVGSSPDGYQQRPSWNFTFAQAADRALVTAEVYDPGTGRFSLTGTLPEPDWPVLTVAGIQWGETDIIVTNAGALVGLADGGALLVGRSEAREGESDNGDGNSDTAFGIVTRTLRLDPRENTWTEIERTFLAQLQDAAPAVVGEPGHTLPDALVVRLTDGRVLAAGGTDPADPELAMNGSSELSVASDSAVLYDPVANTWTTLPPMPEHRAGGAAVALPDGSALLVGGYYEQPSWAPWTYASCSGGGTGLASLVRFVPGR